MTIPNEYTSKELLEKYDQEFDKEDFALEDAKQTHKVRTEILKEQMEKDGVDVAAYLLRRKALKFEAKVNAEIDKFDDIRNGLFKEYRTIPLFPTKKEREAKSKTSTERTKELVQAGKDVLDAADKVVESSKKGADAIKESVKGDSQTESKSDSPEDDSEAIYAPEMTGGFLGDEDRKAAVAEKRCNFSVQISKVPVPEDGGTVNPEDAYPVAEYLFTMETLGGIILNNEVVNGELPEEDWPCVLEGRLYKVAKSGKLGKKPLNTAFKDFYVDVQVDPTVGDFVMSKETKEHIGVLTEIYDAQGVKMGKVEIKDDYGELIRTDQHPISELMVHDPDFDEVEKPVETPSPE